MTIITMKLRRSQLERLDDIIKRKFKLDFYSHYGEECFLYIFSHISYFSPVHSAKHFNCYISRNEENEGYTVRIELADMARSVQYLDPFYDYDVELESKVKETIRKNLAR